MAVLASACSAFSNSALGSRNVSVFDLKPGDCVTPPTQIKASISTVVVLPCHEAHTQQVYALAHDNAGADANYPGTPALRTFANASCLQEFAGYVGVDYRDSTLFYTYLLPSVRSWAADDRTVVCIVTTTGQKLTQSVKGSKI